MIELEEDDEGMDQGAEDDFFLELTRKVARESKHQWTKDGAVIVNSEGKIVATGYNKGRTPAEVQAILSTKADLWNCSLYISRWYPSDKTLDLIAESGISRVLNFAPAVDIDRSRVVEIGKFLKDNRIEWTRVFDFLRFPQDFSGDSE